MVVLHKRAMRPGRGKNQLADTDAGESMRDEQNSADRAWLGADEGAPGGFLTVSSLTGGAVSFVARGRGNWRGKREDGGRCNGVLNMVIRFGPADFGRQAVRRRASNEAVLDNDSGWLRDTLGHGESSMSTVQRMEVVG